MDCSDPRRAYASTLAWFALGRFHLAAHPTGDQVNDYLERWLTDVVAGSVRESTLHAYRNWVVNHLALPRAQGGIGDIPLDKLTPDDVQRMLTARKATGLSATSIDRIRSTLRIALNQAVKWVVSRAMPRRLRGPRTGAVRDPAALNYRSADVLGREPRSPTHEPVHARRHDGDAAGRTACAALAGR